MCVAALCAVLSPALAAHAAPQVGVAAAVRGSVRLDREGAIGVKVESGEKVFLGDRISTAADSRLQVMLLDETVFTLGPSSTMVIDEFVYDPATGDGSLDTELVRGAFRFVSGRIAKRSPENMRVRLPAGTIGIRGTMVHSSVDPDTGRSLVVLTGPGEQNTAGVSPGSIAVESQGVTQDVMRSGWGVEIAGFGAPPSEPFFVPAELYQNGGFDAGTSGGGGASGDGGSDGGDSDGDGSSTSDSGSGDTGSRDDSSGSDGTSSSGTTLSAESVATDSSVTGGAGTGDVLSSVDTSVLGLENLGQDMTTTMAMQMATQMETMSANTTTLTQLAELAAMTQGSSFGYDFNDAGLANGAGTFDLILSLDLQAMALFASFFDLQASPLGTTGSGFGSTSVPLSAGATQDGVQVAKYTLQFSYMESVGSCMAGCPVTIGVELRNTAVQLAGEAHVQGTITDPGQSIIVDIVPATVPAFPGSQG
jgi:hypothetical protein